MTTKTKTTHTATFRLVATTWGTREEVVILTAKSLQQLFERFERKAARFEALGYSNVELEDNTLGRGLWFPTLREHVRSLYKQGQLSRGAYRELRHFAG